MGDSKWGHMRRQSKKNKQQKLKQFYFELEEDEDEYGKYKKGSKKTNDR